MANKRISELTSITGANLADADLLVVVDVSDPTMAASGTNKKITMAELAKDSALTDNLIAKTTLTTDGDVLTRAAGAPARITRADLAQDSAFSSRYKPLASDRLVFTPGSFVVTSNAPTFGTLGNAGASSRRVPAMLFRDAQADQIGITTVVPQGWATYDIYLWWSNAGANAGAVAWFVYAGEFATTETTDVDPTYSANNTSTALAQYELIRLKHNSTALSCTPGELVRINVLRSGNNAGDTLTNDAGLVAIELVRAS